MLFILFYTSSYLLKACYTQIMRYVKSRKSFCEIIYHYIRFVNKVFIFIASLKKITCRTKITCARCIHNSSPVSAIKAYRAHFNVKLTALA